MSALGSAAALASAPFPASGAGIELAYDIHVGGLRAGAVEVAVELEAERYSVAAQTRSSGLVDALIGFRSEARSHGARREDELRPIAHAADNQWRGEARRVRISYDGEDVVASAEPPAEQDDRDPVPPALTRGAVDPLTAALQTALAAQAGRPCEGRLEVFDGRRRYALHFEDRQREPAGLRCRIRLERIAGMSHDPWLPIFDPVETADLWLERLRPDLPPIPVRLEAETALGAAIVRLAALDGAPP